MFLQWVASLSVTYDTKGVTQTRVDDLENPEKNWLRTCLHTLMSILVDV